jgi:ABC-type uncharacterized transport system substrate-binding protein
MRIRAAAWGLSRWSSASPLTRRFLLGIAASGFLSRRDLLAALTAITTLRPLFTYAQDSKMPVIGYLGAGSAGSSGWIQDAFREGLSEMGYFESQNTVIEYRWADGNYDRLNGFAADLVARKVDVIAAQSTLSAIAAKAATSSIPIVFTSGADPVAAGLIATLARPGGNLTGISFLTVELMSKRLELLSQLVPEARVIALLVNPRISAAEFAIRDTQEAGRAKGVELHVIQAATESEIDAAFASLAELRPGALVVFTDPFFSTRRDQLVALTARHRLPAIYDGRIYASVGGLISYGTDVSSVYRLQGSYAGKILKGVKPADLPVQQPTKFELIINLKTAKTLGLTVPQSLLARADEVIE